MDLELQRNMSVVIIDLGAFSVLHVRGLGEITKAKCVGREKQTMTELWGKLEFREPVEEEES